MALSDLYNDAQNSVNPAIQRRPMPGLNDPLMGGQPNPLGVTAPPPGPVFPPQMPPPGAGPGRVSPLGGPGGGPGGGPLPQGGPGGPPPSGGLPPMGGPKPPMNKGTPTASQAPAPAAATTPDPEVFQPMSTGSQPDLATPASGGLYGSSGLPDGITRRGGPPMSLGGQQGGDMGAPDQGGDLGSLIAKIMMMANRGQQ